MSDFNDRQKLPESEDFFSGSGISRRDFFKYAGASAAAAATVGLVGCDDDDEVGPGSNKTTVNLGAGDVGVLNTAFALEQLEAAFYAKVETNINDGKLDFGSDVKNNVFIAIARHEKAHMLFLGTVLGQVAGDDKIPSLAPFLDFDKANVDFTSADSILANSHALEETGVGAYNGAGQFLKTDAYLTIAGKIVSVEARHTSIVNTLFKPNNPKFFAENRPEGANGRLDFGANPNGLDQAFTVEQSLTNASAYLNTDKLELKFDQVGK